MCLIPRCCVAACPIILSSGWMVAFLFLLSIVFTDLLLFCSNARLGNWRKAAGAEFLLICGITADGLFSHTSLSFALFAVNRFMGFIHILSTETIL